MAPDRLTAWDFTLLVETLLDLGFFRVVVITDHARPGHRQTVATRPRLWMV
jgi:hypothetical protein